MHLLVCYDVPCNRRRARLAKRLRERIDRVQKSVFEGQLDERGYLELKAIVQDEIDPAEDNVRIYRLCRRCIVSVETLGVTIVVGDPDEDRIL